MFPVCQHSTLGMSFVGDNSSNYESFTFNAEIMNTSNFETQIEENLPYQQLLSYSDFSLQHGRNFVPQNDQRQELESFTYNWDEFRATSSYGTHIKPENNQTHFYCFASDNSVYSYKIQNSVRRTEDLPFTKLHTGKKCRRHLINQSSHFITKRKQRTVFNTKQILMLENIFKKNPYVSREERKMLMDMLNVSDPVIKVWFQNRRRLSSKRDKELSDYYNSDSSIEENDSNLTLDYVESKINQADEFGYVTLDDRAMRELITVIDSRLTIEIDLDEPCKEFKDDTSSTNIIYEPISPVSMQDGEEDEHICASRWQPHEPEESLRRLFDVQAFIIK